MLQLILLMVGLMAVIGGVAAVSIPAALIVGGAALCAFALFWDFNPPKGGAE